MRRAYLVDEDLIVSLASFVDYVFDKHSVSDEQFREIMWGDSRVDAEVVRDALRGVPGIVHLTIEESEMLDL